jgi:hypothetical protein
MMKFGKFRWPYYSKSGLATRRAEAGLFQQVQFMDSTLELPIVRRAVAAD